MNGNQQLRIRIYAPHAGPERTRRAAIILSDAMFVGMT
jgi:hypothetical protein